MSTDKNEHVDFSDFEYDFNELSAAFESFESICNTLSSDKNQKYVFIKVPQITSFFGYTTTLATALEPFRKWLTTKTTVINNNSPLADKLNNIISEEDLKNYLEQIEELQRYYIKKDDMKKYLKEFEYYTDEKFKFEIQSLKNKNVEIKVYEEIKIEDAIKYKLIKTITIAASDMEIRDKHNKTWYETAYNWIKRGCKGIIMGCTVGVLSIFKNLLQGGLTLIDQIFIRRPITQILTLIDTLIVISDVYVAMMGRNTIRYSQLLYNNIIIQYVQDIIKINSDFLKQNGIILLDKNKKYKSMNGNNIVLCVKDKQLVLKETSKCQ